MYSLAPMLGGHELAVGRFTGTELARLSEALGQSKQPVETPLFQYIRKLIDRGRSAIVSIPDGGGKTTFLESMERSGEFFEWGDEENWIFISNCLNANFLAMELWEWEGCPVPTLEEVYEKGRIGHMSRQPHDGLICFYCSRECRLIKLEKSPFFPIFKDDDVRLAFIKIGKKLGGDCPLIKKGFFKGVLESDFMENVVVEVPKFPSGEYLKILSTLQTNRQIIILCPPEAERTLHDAFPNLAMGKAPPMPINLLPEIYSQKLKDAKLTISPLSLSSLNTLAFLSQGNPGRFLQAVSQLIDAIELDECLETVSDTYVSRHIRDKISESMAIKIIIGELRRANIEWVKAKTIHNMLQRFNLEVGLERIGNLMKENFITKRRNPDAEYHIGAEVDEAPLYLTEGTEGG